MKVYRVSRCEYINDLSGKGAASYSGRWHSKGTYILYTASTPSLALLESVVHISNLPVSGYCLACIDIPTKKIKELKVADLPDNWYLNTSPDFLKSIGNSFIIQR